MKGMVLSTIGPERWLPVVGYEGCYSISNHGRCRSEERTVPKSNGQTQFVPGRILKPAPDHRGYLRVNLFTNNIGATCYNHQMVIAAFIGPRPEGLVVRHLNGDQVDNRLENLAYGTAVDNMQDMRKHGRNWQLNKTHCPRNHPYDEENTFYSRLGRRFCRACVREKRAERREARLEARQAA